MSHYTVKNFLDMPFLMKLIVLASLMAPLIALGSILTGSILPDEVSRYEFGAAKNLFELFISVLLTFPIAIVAVMMLLKSLKIRYLYILGWALLCFSPFALSAIRVNHDSVLIELSFNLLLGLVIATYLALSSKVSKYFKQREK